MLLLPPLEKALAMLELQAHSVVEVRQRLAVYFIIFFFSKFPDSGLFKCIDKRVQCEASCLLASVQWFHMRRVSLKARLFGFAF